MSARRAFLDAFAERVRALPGVTAVGSTVTVPSNGTWRNIKLDIDGRPNDGAERPGVARATASWASRQPVNGTTRRQGF